MTSEQSWSVRAPGKINLTLLLGPSRADGRHELVTVFESLSLADTLTLTALAEGQSDSVECPGVEGPNLAGAALFELRRHGWAGPPVRVTIAKRVPVAAGLGGGSADAAATLRLTAALHPHPPGFDAHRVAALLGADVPAQLQPGLWLGTGVGDQLEAMPAVAAHTLVIVPADATLATASVYAEADRLGLGRSAADLVEAADVLRRGSAGAVPPARLLVNDLQPAALSLRPTLAQTLSEVLAAGADQALVCGSGPTVAGLFWGEPERAPEAVRELHPRHPRVTVATGVGAAYGAPHQDHVSSVGHNHGL